MNKKRENKFPPISVHNKASKYITLNDDTATLFFMKTGKKRAKEREKERKTFSIHVTERIKKIPSKLSKRNKNASSCYESNKFKKCTDRRF